MSIIYYFGCAIGVVSLALLFFYLFPHTVIPLIVRFVIIASPFRKKWIQLQNGLWCSYLERGNIDDCKTSILFLHGASGSAVDYLGFGPYFDKSSTHICILNLLNHGDTASYEHDICMNEMTRYIEEFVEKSKLLKQQFHIIGFSMGGYISVHYAAKNPHQIKSVVLMNPAGMHEANNQILKYVSPSGGLKFIESNNEMLELMNLMSNGTMKAPPNLMLTLLRHHKNHTSNRQSLAIRGIFQKPIVDVSTLNDLADMNVLYLQGELDQLAPKEGMEFFKEHLPHTKGHLINKAAHLMTYTHTKEVCAHINSWIGELSTHKKDS